MSDPVKVGVVGTGHLGKHHARIYSNIKNAKLVAVSDIDEKAGSKIARKYNADFYPDYKDIINKVDAVSIVTPTDTHFEVAKDFLENRVDTMVEKPVTNSPEQAEELIRISDEKNCILQVGHVERFNSAVVKAREYINDPRFIEVNRISKYPGRSLDIGVVLDLMIHDIDIILSFVNSPVETISSIGAPLLTENEDIANCRIKFENGCVANVTASRISYKTERKFRVFEPDRYISLDYEKQEFVVYKKKAEKVFSLQDIERISPRFKKKEPLKEELKDFMLCVKEGKQPEVSGHHGLTALKLALDIASRIK